MVFGDGIYWFVDAHKTIYYVCGYYRVQYGWWAGGPYLFKYLIGLIAKRDKNNCAALKSTWTE